MRNVIFEKLKSLRIKLLNCYQYKIRLQPTRTICNENLVSYYVRRIAIHYMKCYEKFPYQIEAYKLDSTIETHTGGVQSHSKACYGYDIKIDKIQ